MTDTSDHNILYPFEIVVEGTPISLSGSSGSKVRWREAVRAVGRERARDTDDLGFLYPCPVALTIYYFPTAAMEGDVDNIVKPIMDALIDVAYRDDRFVERVLIQRFEPQHEWEFDDPSDQLVIALETPLPLVYIRVDDDLSWRRVK